MRRSSLPSSSQGFFGCARGSAQSRDSDGARQLQQFLRGVRLRSGASRARPGPRRFVAQKLSEPVDLLPSSGPHCRLGHVFLGRDLAIGRDVQFTSPRRARSARHLLSRRGAAALVAKPGRCGLAENCIRRSTPRILHAICARLVRVESTERGGGAVEQALPPFLPGRRLTTAKRKSPFSSSGWQESP